MFNLEGAFHSIEIESEIEGVSFEKIINGDSGAFCPKSIGSTPGIKNSNYIVDPIKSPFDVRPSTLSKSTIGFSWCSFFVDREIINSEVEIQVFSSMGVEVWTHELERENNHVVWNGNGVTSGNYIAVICGETPSGNTICDRLLIIVSE